MFGTKHSSFSLHVHVIPLLLLSLFWSRSVGGGSGGGHSDYNNVLGFPQEHSLTSNSLTPFPQPPQQPPTRPEGDEEEEYEEGYEDEEEEETGHGIQWNTDTNDLHPSYPLPPSSMDKPKLGKCCGRGQGLNAQGLCKDLVQHPHKASQPIPWFPEKVFDVGSRNWSEREEGDWELVLSHSFSCPINQSGEVISDTNKFVLLTNGHLFLSHHGKDLAPLHFCLDHLLGVGVGVKSCFSRSDLCSDSRCLRKCCPEGALVEEPSGRCIHVPHISKNKFPLDKWNVVHGSPTCPYGQYWKDLSSGGFSIGPNGALLTPSAGNSSFLDYCLDFFLESPPGTNEGRRKGGPEPTLKAILCFLSYEEEWAQRMARAGLVQQPPLVSLLYGIALVTSCVAIALGALISWHLPELHSLHGKCQLSHMGTLFLLFLSLSVVFLGGDEVPGPLCTALAVTIHSCALSAFLWLNLLCVNIYLTFRSLRPPLAARRDENWRLFFLCVYAWGIPGAFCLFLLHLDSTPGRLDPMPRPEYGELNCLLSNRGAQFAYLYGPVGVLLLVNGVLFYLTSQELLYGVWRLDNSDSINFRRKSMGVVVGKLGIVMGMGWIMDVLSWFLGGQTPWFFYIADIFNALQGVFIFLVLVWRRRVLEVLRIRRRSGVKDESLTGGPFVGKGSMRSTTASSLRSHRSLPTRNPSLISNLSSSTTNTNTRTPSKTSPKTSTLLQSQSQSTMTPRRDIDLPPDSSTPFLTPLPETESDSQFGSFV